MQIVPSDFCHAGTKKECSVTFKIRQNPFSVGALPRTPLVELTTLPQTASRLERGHPPHIPPHSAPTHLLLSPCVTQNSSEIYAYAKCKTNNNCTVSHRSKLTFYHHICRGSTGRQKTLPPNSLPPNMAATNLYVECR